MVFDLFFYCVTVKTIYKFTVVYCESVNLIGYVIVFYLTITLRARIFYEQIVNEAQYPF